MSAATQVERAVEVLTADYARQGRRLDLDQVNRVLDRRGLSGASAAAVFNALAERGVEIEGVDPTSLGFKSAPLVGGFVPTHSADLDLVRMFLRDVGRYRLLTARDEQKLGRRIELGRSALDELETRLGLRLCETESLSRRLRVFDCAMADDDDPTHGVADASLLQQVRDGHAAFNQLLLANLRLVVHIAKRYEGRSDLDLLDLVQEGYLGLVRAAEKFDASLGYKFSTYATWWIRQAVTRAIADKGATVRLPVHVHEKRLQLAKTRRSLVIELGRSPTRQELARELDWDLAQVAAIEELAKFDLASLDAPVASDEDSDELGEFVAGPADLITNPFAGDPAEFVMSILLRDAVDEILDELNERERRVITLRFGLGDGEVRTLEEIGKEFGVTRERIRQIESKTLKKLRHPTRSGVLRDYIDWLPSDSLEDDGATASSEGDDTNEKGEQS